MVTPANTVTPVWIFVAGALMLVLGLATYGYVSVYYQHGLLFVLTVEIEYHGRSRQQTDHALSFSRFLHGTGIVHHCLAGFSV